MKAREKYQGKHILACIQEKPKKPEGKLCSTVMPLFNSDNRLSCLKKMDFAFFNKMNLVFQKNATEQLIIVSVHALACP